MPTRSVLSRVCLPVVPCKFCHYGAPLFGVVDLSKSCEDHRQAPAPLSGIPIYYHRCARCGLIFTTAFDHFSHEDFREHIYNEHYAAFDPDYAEARPAGNAQLLSQIFSGSRDLGILDYGGGNGLLAARLREAGFADVVTYDPFVPEFNSRPDRRFDLVTCFEVVEHTPRPLEIFSELDALMKPEGMILFSTLLQPADIANIGVGWWYLAPRNGHVTLYSGAALQTLLAQKQMRFGSCSATLHAAWRTAPSFAKHFIQE